MVPAGRTGAGVLVVAMEVGGEKGQGCQCRQRQGGDCSAEERKAAAGVKAQELLEAGRCDLIGGWIAPTGGGGEGGEPPAES